MNCFKKKEFRSAVENLFSLLIIASLELLENALTTLRVKVKTKRLSIELKTKLKLRKVKAYL